VQSDEKVYQEPLLPRRKLKRSQVLLEQLSEFKAKNDSIEKVKPKRIPKRINQRVVNKPKRIIAVTDEADTAVKVVRKKTFEENIARIDSLFEVKKNKTSAISKSLTQARNVKNHMTVQQNKLERLITETNKFQHERYRKLSYAATILIMFLIGAPLGAIIKRGGLGFPVLISMAFFILFYVISMICEKWTRQDIMDPLVASWMANFLLLPIGLFFLRQAKNDARIFDTDFYSVVIFRVKKQWNLISSKMKTKK
jgi:lipopolysaccharide export LptBFGC system permease protein LptF